MRRVMWTLACAMTLCGPAAAVPARAPDLSTTDAVLRWINGYRAKPDVVRVPAAVRTLSQLGALRDSETSARAMRHRSAISSLATRRQNPSGSKQPPKCSTPCGVTILRPDRTGR
jgi:hypothetical protein